MQSLKQRYLGNKYLGIATVAVGCVAAFAPSDTNGMIALMVSAAFMGAYWLLYGDQ
jgi:hypothetical protein